MEKIKNKKTEEYPIKAFRLNNNVWEKLKRKKIESGLSWNLFVNLILEKYETIL